MKKKSVLFVAFSLFIMSFLSIVNVFAEQNIYVGQIRTAEENSKDLIMNVDEKKTIKINVNETFFTEKIILEVPTALILDEGQPTNIQMLKETESTRIYEINYENEMELKYTVRAISALKNQEIKGEVNGEKLKPLHIKISESQSVSTSELSSEEQTVETKESSSDSEEVSETKQEKEEQMDSSKEEATESSTSEIQSNDSDENSQNEQNGENDHFDERATASLPDFNWSLLNSDGLNLSTYQEVSTNTPVPLSGGVFDKKLRQYYLFFGHVGRDSKFNYQLNDFVKEGNLYAELSKRDTDKLPALSPMMIGIEKDSHGETYGKPFGYDYDYSYNGKGSSTANFDIGELENNQIVRSSIADGVSTNTYIVKQYHKKNEIIVYGYLATKEKTISSKKSYIPVRVRGYVVNEKIGRVRYDVSFYNDSNQKKEYALTYGLHADIGGAHEQSKLYSNSQDGIFFLQEKAPNDNITSRLFFYTNNGYGISNGPKDYKTGNLGSSSYNIASWRQIKVGRWTNPLLGNSGYDQPYQKWDDFLPKETAFDLNHPIFALRWNPISVASKSTGTASLDLSLDETPGTMPPELPEDNIIEITEKVTDSKSKTADTAYPGDELTYRATAKTSVMNPKDELSFSFFVTQLDQNLTDVKDIVFKDKNQNIVGLGNYSKGSHSINAYTTKSVSSEVDIYLEYKATVKKETPIGTIVKAKSVFEANLKNGGKIKSTESNEVMTEIIKKRQLEEEVLNEKGEIATEAEAGEKLHYKATLKGDDGQTPETKQVNKKEADKRESAGKVTIMYVDENKNEIAPAKILNGTTGMPISPSDKERIKISGYVSNGVSSWSGMDNKESEGDLINYYYPWEQKLIYKYKKFSGEIQYSQLTFIQILDPHLAQPENITLKKTDGTIVGTGEYDDSTRTVKATLNTEVPQKEDILFEFDTKINEKVAEGTFIKGFSTAKGEFNNETRFDEVTSNEVSTKIIEREGYLTLVSAPETISFGEDLEINATKKEYPIVLKNNDLIVRDDRKEESPWRMTAKLLADFETLEKEALNETLYYRLHNKESIISKASESLIVERTSKPLEEINISKEWQNENGLFLSVPGNVAKAKRYHSVVQWSLQDVPMNGEG
ncbi:hypothetical protein FDP48_10930 [Enterococcus faecalis]|uniref:MucBP domain-containing protein n=1 Tax=Enterococcus faecalis TaxID=1351 RepID=UPI00129C92DB|nr:MucBP domain-containing protein [Enterococcus faecalis]MRJ30461.1 hypothetical protein [Enterococcus faecalis]